MVAKIDQLFLCPKCSEGISAPQRPERCPNCSYRFRLPGESLAKKFSWGKSPDEQFFELVQQDMEKFLDRPISEIAKELLPGVQLPEDIDEATLSNEQRFRLIKQFREKQKDQFFMQSHVKDVEGWFKCMHYLMTLVIPSGNRELAMQAAVWGKQIGKMAEGIEKYLEGGGRTYEHKITTTGRDQ